MEPHQKTPSVKGDPTTALAQISKVLTIRTTNTATIAPSSGHLLKPGFLRLALETRDQIYSYIIPQNMWLKKVNAKHAKRVSRHDEAMTSMRSLRVNNQIYAEAHSALLRYNRLRIHDDIYPRRLAMLKEGRNFHVKVGGSFWLSELRDVVDHFSSNQGLWSLELDVRMNGPDLLESRLYPLLEKLRVVKSRDFGRLRVTCGCVERTSDGFWGMYVRGGCEGRTSDGSCGMYVRGGATEKYQELHKFLKQLKADMLQNWA